MNHTPTFGFVHRWKEHAKAPYSKGRKDRIVRISATYYPVYRDLFDAEFDQKNHFQDEVYIQPVLIVDLAEHDALVKAAEKAFDAIQSLIAVYPENITRKLCKAHDVLEQALANAGVKP